MAEAKRQRGGGGREGSETGGAINENLKTYSLLKLEKESALVKICCYINYKAFS